MKKMWILLLAAALFLAFTACTQTGRQNPSSQGPSSAGTSGAAVQPSGTDRTTDPVTDASPQTSGDDNVIDWGAGGDEFGGDATTGGSEAQSSRKPSETSVSSSDVTTDTSEPADTSASTVSSTQNSNDESSATSEYSRVVK